MTVLADSKCSVDQTVDQTDGPQNISASFNLPQPQTSSDPLSPQASGGPSPPKPLTAKPRSIKSPAPPIPSGIPATKPSSPVTQFSTAHSQSTKVKYRAPLPPVQSGTSKLLAADTSEPSSLFAATSPGATVNAVEPPSGSIKTPTGVSLNGTKPQLTATNFGVSSESSATSANPQNLPSSPDLVTVSALVSSTIKGLIPPTTSDKLTPTSTTPSISPGPNRVTDSPIISTFLSSSKDQGLGKDTLTMSPTSPNQGKFTLSSHSPTGPPGPLPKEPHLRYVQQISLRFNCS